MSIAQLSVSKRATQLTLERLSSHMVRRWPVFVLSSGTLSSTNEGAYATGKISEEERLDVIRHACPGSGACCGMFTYGGVFHEVHLRILRFTPQGQYYGNRPRSFGVGPPVLFWDPRRLPWSSRHFLEKFRLTHTSPQRKLKNVSKLPNT
jgi:hypothetical protein